MKEIVKAFNKLVFLTPRRLNSITTVQQLSVEVQKDFLIVFNRLFIKRKLKKYEGSAEKMVVQIARESYDPSKGPDEDFKHHNTVRSIAYFFSNHLDGPGFTPKLVRHKRFKKDGFTCLGKAIMLGVLLRRVGIKVRLAILPDHAALILTTKNGTYFVDSNEWNPHLLHGTYQSHRHYTWYVVAPEDELIFHYIVVYDFDRGLIQAICENFAFMKAAVELSLSQDKMGSHEKELVGLLNSQHPFNKTQIVQRTDWAGFQKRFLRGMNSYKHHHEREVLVHDECLRRHRLQRELSVELSDISAEAYEYAIEKPSTTEDIQSFHREQDGFLMAAHERLIDAIEQNTEATLLLISQGQMISAHPLIPRYMQYFYSKIKENELLRDSFIIWMKRRLLTMREKTDTLVETN